MIEGLFEEMLSLIMQQGWGSVLTQSKYFIY